MKPSGSESSWIPRRVTTTQLAMVRSASAALVATALVTLPTPARAGEPQFVPLGARNQLVLTSAARAEVRYRQQNIGNQGELSLAVSPSLDWFFVKNVSLGLSLAGSSWSAPSTGSTYTVTSRTVLSAAARLGVVFALGRRVALYPMFSLGIESTHEEQTAGSSTLSPLSPLTKIGPWVQLVVPLFVQPRPHFFLGGGPAVTHELDTIDGDSHGQRTTVGAMAFVGGDWGGERRTADSEDETAEPSPPPPARFGLRKQVVFQGDVGLSGSYALFDQNGSTRSSLAFDPSFDYFVVDHLSVGVEGNVHYRNAASILAGSEVGIGLASVFGFAITLTDWLSFYPRVTFGFGWTRATGLAAGPTNLTTLVVGAYAPLIVTIAEHFFFGLGPRASADVLDLAGDWPSPVRSTTIGANTVVGGWL